MKVIIFCIFGLLFTTCIASAQGVERSIPSSYDLPTLNMDQEVFEKCRIAIVELNHKELQDFSNDAIQAVESFSGYLEIISDKERSMEERRDAFILMADMFIDKKRTVQHRKADQPLSYLDYLEMILNGQTLEGMLQWSNLDSSNSKFFDETNCAKRVSFIETQMKKNVYGNPEIINNQKKNIQVFLMYKKKKLAGKSKEVLQVGLGNIYF